MPWCRLSERTLLPFFLGGEIGSRDLDERTLYPTVLVTGLYLDEHDNSFNQ